MQFGKEFWDVYTQLYALWMPHFVPHRQLLDELLAHARISKHASVIDAGCGPGLLITRLLEQGHEGPIYGYDFSPSAVEAARKRLADYAHIAIEQVDLEVMDWNRVPKADAIFNTNVLYALKDPEPVVRHATSRLKPGGVLAISTLSNPNVDLLVRAHHRWTRLHATLEQRRAEREQQWAFELMGLMNTQIARATQARFHVWDEAKLCSVVESTGLCIQYRNGAAYAGTGALVIARAQ